MPGVGWEPSEDLPEYSEGEEASGEDGADLLLHGKLAVEDDAKVAGMVGGFGVGPTSGGHHLLFQRASLPFPKKSTSILSVLSFRQLLFIQTATSFKHLRNLSLVVVMSLVRERMSWVSCT